MQRPSGHALKLTEIDGLLVAEFSGEDTAIVYDPVECSVSVVRLEQDAVTSGVPTTATGAGSTHTVKP
ncbi:hypothetical protein [Methyloversatilis thermotolerans]|uniref:hypothetical protein n=1 Tax=Methyloversatilis thermotolerans TaxID=1346290 RepID=UPI000380D7C7|nr:hypothetical protein [Methyloversatilis thermotolerans]